jgi:hypothetical protein
MAIAACMSFNSGILLFTDAAPRGRTPKHSESHKIFRRQYGTPPGCACSVFVLSEPSNGRSVLFERCEGAIALLDAADCTLDRLRQTAEDSFRHPLEGAAQAPAPDDHASAFVVLYSPCEKLYAAFRTSDDLFHEVGGYDCLGRAAHIGHYLIRDRYFAARSMDGLDLSTVFEIAVDALEGIRICDERCGKSSEMVVMYADGHVSAVQRIPHDTPKECRTALAALART